MNEKMRELTVGLPLQLVRAIEIANSSTLKPFENINNVVLSGLGGSGIGATIVSNWVSDSCPVPITINKGYFCPKSVKKDSLVICCSYSGNTEETLKVLHDAHEKQAKIVCVSSGGSMIDFCKEKGIDYIQVDGGMPPRTCIGYSLAAILHIFSFYNLCNVMLKDQFKRVSPFLIDLNEEITDISKNLTDSLYNKLPVLYADEINTGVVVRYRQQINENAKMLCWHHVIPEMNHNEMVGWHDKNDNLAVLFLNSDYDYIRNVQRKEINEKVIRNYTPNVYNIKAKGDNLIEQSMYLIYLCDILSIDLADKRNVDAMDITVINDLKSQLSDLSW